MTQLLKYLDHYQARDQREKIFVGVLTEGLLLAGRRESLLNQGDSRQLRQLDFQTKRWRSQLITQVFYQLPALSRPRQEVLAQYREEYDSLANEIAAEFAQRIFIDFNPDLSIQGENLTAKLTIWVNSKLRLKWRILDLITPKKKTPEIRLLEIILNLVSQSPDGFTKTEFLTAIEQNLKCNPITATEFLLDLVPRFWCAPPDGDRYFLSEDLLQNHLEQLYNRIYLTVLDENISEETPDPLYIPQVKPSVSLPKKIAQILVQYRANLKEICIKNNPDCHCVLLLENYFKEQLYQVDINEEAIIRLLGVKRPTYQSHLERKCLPAFWELAIYTSPVSQPDPQKQEIYLKIYIETDPKLLLKKCYYSDQNRQEYFDCNCQNLAKKILIFFIPKPEKWKNLALFHQLTVDTLTRFWKMKCLFLLSLVVFELESEYTDSLDMD